MLSHANTICKGFNDSSKQKLFVFDSVKRLAPDLVITLVHECTHNAMGFFFKNLDNPFYATTDISSLFIDKTKSAIKLYPATFDPIEKYNEIEYPRELIAYYFEAVSENIVTGKNIHTVPNAKSCITEIIFNSMHEIDSSLVIEDLPFIGDTSN